MKNEDSFKRLFAYYIFFFGATVNTLAIITSLNIVRVMTGVCWLVNLASFLIFCIKLKKYDYYIRLTFLLIGLILIPSIFMISVTPEIAVNYSYIMPCIYMISVKKKKDMILPIINGILMAVLVYIRLGLEFSITVLFIFTFCIMLGSLFSKSMFSSFDSLELAYDFISDAAKKDKLTGINNRYGLDEALKIRTKNPCYAIMLDIDFFKSINDTYGHDAGDEILLKFGKILSDSEDSYFLVSRWGGEEFLLVSFLSKEETFEKLKSIYDAVDKELIIDGKSVHISSGVSKRGFMDKALRADADENLYRSKTTGRNKCSFRMQDVKL